MYHQLLHPSIDRHICVRFVSTGTTSHFVFRCPEEFCMVTLYYEQLFLPDIVRQSWGPDCWVRMMMVKDVVKSNVAD